MSQDPTDKSRRNFLASSSVLGAAGALWAALPFAGAAGSMGTEEPALLVELALVGPPSDKTDASEPASDVVPSEPPQEELQVSDASDHHQRVPPVIPEARTLGRPYFLQPRPDIRRRGQVGGRHGGRRRQSPGSPTRRNCPMSGRINSGCSSLRKTA